MRSGDERDRGRGTLLRLAAALATALALAMVLGAASVLAAGHGKQGTRHGTEVEILAPQNGSRPLGSAVVVRVRVRGGHFRAYLDGRPVTSRFHGKGIRTATFRPGGPLGPGPANLFVTAGKGRTASAASANFVVRRRDQKLLSLSVSRKGGFVAPRVRLRTDEPLLDSKVWLNGRRIDARLDAAADQQGLNGRLEAVRLRFGSNRLKVMVLQEDGLFAEHKIRFWVDRTRPIASAGHDRRIGIGGRARLNASGSRRPLRFVKLTPAPPPSSAPVAQASAATTVSPPTTNVGTGPLTYEWKILNAPPGSEAKILEPTEKEAELLPDVPGEYVAAVTVTAADGTQSVDDVAVQAPQTVGPMGMPIQTITEAGAIQIGDPEQAGAMTYPRDSKWVQMLVLEGATAAPPISEGPWDSHSGVPEKKFGVLGFEPGQGAKLLEAVEATSVGQLVILSGQGLSVSMGKGDREKLKKAIEYLGGTLASSGTTPEGVVDLNAGTWSMIGHKELAVGRAYQNAFAKEQGIPGFLGGATGMGGSLNGYLQSGNDTNGFQYVSPEVVSIDTKWTPSPEVAPSPAQNTIKIGEDKYASAPIDTGAVAGCPCSVGMQVLYLDPATLAVTSSGTYGILTMDGSTDFAGIHALDEELHMGIANHGVGASSLVVVQDFGSWLNGNWPGGNSTDWLQDTLPHNEYTPWWKGYNFPNQASKLAVSWNQANQYGLGSVAGNLGNLVSPGFHDVVANYRRPVYQPGPNGSPGKIVPRVWGGLTAIASTNLFERDAAFGAGQGTAAPPGAMPTPGTTALYDNGRITGALTRDHQGQWELTSQTAGAGVPGAAAEKAGSGADEFASSALPELVMAPQHPYTCTAEHPAPCPGTGAELTKAMAYITGSIPQLRGFADARDDYLNKNVSWAIAYSQITGREFVNCHRPEAEFTSQTCEALRKVLAAEFADLQDVETGFTNLLNLMEGPDGQVGSNLKKVMEAVNSEVLQAKKSLLREETDFNSHEWIEDAIFAASGVMAIAGATEPEIGAFAYSPGALSAIAYLLKFSDDSKSFFEPKKTKTAEQIPDNTGLIKTRVANLQEQLENALAQVKPLLRHYEDIVKSDPVKLEEAANNFGAKWSQTTKTELDFEQALSLGIASSAYEAIMPLAFNQWIVSPRATSTNVAGPAELPNRGYSCTYQNGEGYPEGFDPPLENEPASMSGMNSVAWSGAPSGRQVGYTIRALKEKDNDIVIESAQHQGEYGNNLVHHRGESPKAKLTDRLFELPSPTAPAGSPRGLGIDKEEFFGMESWRLRMIQCGYAEN